jgi:hypothetical protein
MSQGTYLRFPHKISVYTRTTSTNDAGQRTVDFTLASNVKAYFQSVSSERRIAPYTANIDEFQFYISHKDQLYADYGNRIQNVVDRYSNVIEAGPFEIINIEKKIGFNGKVTHVLLTTRRVIEGA